jgi:hypothetical protein
MLQLCMYTTNTVPSYFLAYATIIQFMSIWKITNNRESVMMPLSPGLSGNQDRESTKFPTFWYSLLHLKNNTVNVSLLQLQLLKCFPGSSHKSLPKTFVQESIFRTRMETLSNFKMRFYRYVQISTHSH